MRGLLWTVSVLLSVLTASGCNGPSKRTLASSEPSLSAASTGESNVSIIDRAKPAPGSTAFADRHPLFSKPRQYYENTNRGKVSKTAAATLIGVPAGLFGEFKQMVAGTPHAGGTP